MGLRVLVDMVLAPVEVGDITVAELCAKDGAAADFYGTVMGPVAVVKCS